MNSVARLAVTSYTHGSLEIKQEVEGNKIAHYYSYYYSYY